MNERIQTVVALALVAVAAAWLVWRGVVDRSRTSGCGDGGCAGAVRGPRALLKKAKNRPSDGSGVR